MKTIGILGGMSWESTAVYYEHINRLIRAKLGGLHSAKIALWSFDMDEIAVLQAQDKWKQAGLLLTDAAQKLEQAGADMIIIATNTMHKLAPMITAEITIPLVHILDVTAQAIQAEHMHKVALLGTRFTMEEDFYTRHMAEHGIEIMTPDAPDRTIIHDIIYDELCKGMIKDESRQNYLRIINDLSQQGAQGIILGCTEIGLLVKASDTTIPLFDTTVIHAKAAVEKALQ